MRLSNGENESTRSDYKTGVWETSPAEGGACAEWWIKRSERCAADTAASDDHSADVRC
jgi:hypothetical protein